MTGALTLFLMAAGLQAQDGGVSDLHNSVLYRMFRTNDPEGLLKEEFPVNLSAMESVDTRFMVFSIGIPRFSLSSSRIHTLDEVIGFLESFQQIHRGQDGPLRWVETKSGLDEALASEQIPYTLGLEGSWLLDGDPDESLDRIHEVGVRVINPAHWFHNDFFLDPALPNPPNKAPRPLHDETRLSPQGERLIERMIEKGITIDVSHLRRAAFDQVVGINARRTMLIASHANARALCDVPRNLADEQIRSIAETGGIIGVCLHQPILVEEDRPATTGDVVDHIEHLLKIAGEDHVAIGTDLEGRTTPPQGIRRYLDLPAIAVEMQERGYGESVIEGVLWRNALQVLPE